MRKSMFLFAFLLLSVSLTLLAQDDTNLLTNPGFEQPYNDSATDPARQRIVADGWTPWDVTAVEIQPEYAPASAVRPERVLSEEDSQTYIAFLAAPTGGLYQTVTGVTPGETYTFGVSAYVWSSQDDLNADVSVDPGVVTVEVGIDPTGGTDPESTAIVWAGEGETYDELRQHLVSAVAESETVTVFIRVVIENEVFITEVYFDDASLTLGGEATVPTDEFNPEVTADASPEATEEPVATEEPTEVATEEPTDEIIVPPTDEVVVTEEQAPTTDPNLFATATALIAEATQRAIDETLTAEQPVVDTGATETADAQATNNASVFITATAVVLQFTETAAVVNQTNTAVADLNATTAAQITQTLESSLVSANATGTALAMPTVPPTDEPVVVPTDVPATDIPTTEPTEEVAPTEEPEATVEGTEPEATVETTEPEATAEATSETVEPISETFPGQIIHTVQPGDTVAGLALLYDSTIEVIIEANGLDANALIYVGQGLVIPVRIAPATATPTQTPVVIVVTATAEGTDSSGEPTSGDGSYVIRPGDTLTTIARRYNTTVRTLAELNGIVNVNSIQAGQRLIVPTGAAAPTAIPEATAETEATEEPAAEPTTYRVQPGDSLYTIAIRNGVTVRELAELNKISNINLIYVGQVLQLP